MLVQMSFSVKRDLLHAIGGVGKDVKDGLAKIRGSGAGCGGRGTSKGGTKSSVSPDCVDVDGEVEEGAAGTVEDAEPVSSLSSLSARSSRATGAVAKRTAEAAALATASLERKNGKRGSDSPSVSPTAAAPLEEHQPHDGMHEQLSMYLQQSQPVFQQQQLQPMMYHQQQSSYPQPMFQQQPNMPMCPQPMYAQQQQQQPPQVMYTQQHQHQHTPSLYQQQQQQSMYQHQPLYQQQTMYQHQQQQSPVTIAPSPEVAVGGKNKHLLLGNGGSNKR